MTKFIDLTNQRFGRLIVLNMAGKSNTVGSRNHIIWNCVCDCGNKITTKGYLLRQGGTRSCGCLRREGCNFKHGYARKTGISKEYRCWSRIKERCYKPEDHNYKYYGARGIKMCDRWRDSFENFLEDMGNIPAGKSLDRINNDGDYEPSNCRWATAKEQANNRRPHNTVI